VQRCPETPVNGVPRHHNLRQGENEPKIEEELQRRDTGLRLLLADEWASVLHAAHSATEPFDGLRFQLWLGPKVVTNNNSRPRIHVDRDHFPHGEGDYDRCRHASKIASMNVPELSTSSGAAPISIAGSSGQS
jgi:hypothetical protein